MMAVVGVGVLRLLLHELSKYYQVAIRASGRDCRVNSLLLSLCNTTVEMYTL
jgi:hypothetical protein